MTPLLVVVGPTASGKTALALELAERLSGEIVNADSVQIYRYFDIGSGKPTPDELRRAPHHLLSFVEPGEEFEARRWAKAAEEVVREVEDRGGTPILCGGTFLWIVAFLYGLADAPAGSPELRREHEAFVAKAGRAALHARLARVDPEIALRLHENDFVRVSRALEVYELTGRKLSDLQREHGFRETRYRPLFLGIEHPKDAYDERVAARVRGMFDAGFIDEVRSLIARGFLGTRAMAAVGYRQIAAALDSGLDLDEAALLLEIVKVTKVFARRQRTWLRERPIRWLTPEEATDPRALDLLAVECRAHLGR